MRRSPLVILSNGDVGEIQAGDSLDKNVFHVEEFIGSALPNYLTAFSAGAGAGANMNLGTLAGTFGAVNLATGTTATGRSGIHCGQNQILIGGNFYLGIGFRFYLPIVSNATNRFTTRFGISSAVATAGDQTGIYFRYNDSVAGGVIQGVTRNGATETVVNSTIIPAENTIYDLYFLVNSTGTSVSFYINDVLIGTSSTNLPSTATNLGVFSSIQKSVGTGSVSLRVDRWFGEIVK